MKKLVLFVLPLIAVGLLLSGMGKKPVAEESSLSTPMTACSSGCMKECKVCAKDMKNCGKEGCICKSTECKPGMKCADCKNCVKDMKNCGKADCTCMNMDKKDMKGMKHGKMKGKNAETSSKLFIRTPAKEELGKEVTCPVMTTEKFKVSTVTPVIDYKGKAYFMCCNGCPQKFMANPEKYVK
ncbi:MAG: hypothetical protein A2231_01955 [Candidatus Firestonebacteria bacterium RIFOXYA2_FULL_40_8]|nr:MAG: hypothetical protein A2231_01955 [Candidatus Firestonebacteria bacterium RIFOXYA2_FULL_40_8]